QAAARGADPDLLECSRASEPAAEWDTPRSKVSGPAKEWGPSVAALVKRGEILAQSGSSAAGKTPGRSSEDSGRRRASTSPLTFALRGALGSWGDGRVRSLDSDHISDAKRVGAARCTADW